MERECEHSHLHEESAVDETGYSEKKRSLIVEGGIGEGGHRGVQQLFDPKQLGATQKAKKGTVTIFSIDETS